MTTIIGFAALGVPNALLHPRDAGPSQTRDQGLRAGVNRAYGAVDSSLSAIPHLTGPQMQMVLANHALLEVLSAATQPLGPAVCERLTVAQADAAPAAQAEPLRPGCAVGLSVALLPPAELAAQPGQLEGIANAIREHLARTADPSRPLLMLGSVEVRIGPDHRAVAVRFGSLASDALNAGGARPLVLGDDGLRGAVAAPGAGGLPPAQPIQVGSKSAATWSDCNFLLEDFVQQEYLRAARGFLIPGEALFEPTPAMTALVDRLSDGQPAAGQQLLYLVTGENTAVQVLEMNRDTPFERSQRMPDFASARTAAAAHPIGGGGEPAGTYVYVACGRPDQIAAAVEAGSVPRALWVGALRIFPDGKIFSMPAIAPQSAASAFWDGQAAFELRPLPVPAAAVHLTIAELADGVGNGVPTDVHHRLLNQVEPGQTITMHTGRLAADRVDPVLAALMNVGFSSVEVGYPHGEGGPVSIIATRRPNALESDG